MGCEAEKNPQQSMLSSGARGHTAGAEDPRLRSFGDCTLPLAGATKSYPDNCQMWENEGFAGSYGHYKLSPFILQSHG